MTMILCVIMLFCVFRCVQEVLVRNYKRAAFCLIGTLFLFVAMNGGVYMAINQLRLIVGDTVFNIIFFASEVVFSIFIGICFYQSIKELGKKNKL